MGERRGEKEMNGKKRTEKETEKDVRIHRISGSRTDKFGTGNRGSRFLGLNPLEGEREADVIR